MVFERFFFKKTKQTQVFVAPEVTTAGIDARLQLLTRECYVEFLNDYVSEGLDESAGEKQVQKHYAAQVKGLKTLLTSVGNMPEAELEATERVEQQKQKALRNYRQLMEVTMEVLKDQRNYMLARHINHGAAAMGFKTDTPFSGMETENGQPCHAFACKLLADSSLGRGFSKGLLEDSVTLLEHHIAQRADAEVTQFLEHYRGEHSL